jgi:hypothetical protein
MIFGRATKAFRLMIARPVHCACLTMWILLSLLWIQSYIYPVVVSRTILGDVFGLSSSNGRANLEQWSGDIGDELWPERGSGDFPCERFLAMDEMSFRDRYLGGYSRRQHYNFSAYYPKMVPRPKPNTIERHWWIAYAPMWAIMVIFPTIAAWRWSKLYLRQQKGLCAHCGYDLRATPGRCPECGAIAETRPQ